MTKYCFKRRVDNGKNILYNTSYLPWCLQDLSNEKMDELFRVIFDYEIDRIEPVFISSDLAIAFKFLKLNLDLNTPKYNDICEKNKNNACKWAVANGSSGNDIQRTLEVVTKEKEEK